MSGIYLGVTNLGVSVTGNCDRQFRDFI